LYGLCAAVFIPALKVASSALFAWRQNLLYSLRRKEETEFRESPVPDPARENFICQVLTWNRVARDTKELSRRVRDSGFVPDMVVAIGRGGLVPARVLCDYLRIKDLTTIKVEHWGIAATPDEKARIRFPLCADIAKRRVLLVDDITDTGETLELSSAYLREFGPEEVRTAVLIHKAAATFEPTYYVTKHRAWRWVIFPWHLWEDVTGFIEILRDEGVRGEECIRDELKKRYALHVRIETIMEILEELDSKGSGC
jgi:hypoxanthine phosphoribosyltransferase